MYRQLIFLLGSFLLPITLYAQPVFNPNSGIGGLFLFLGKIITTTLIPLLFAVALLLFIFGIVNMVINPNNEQKREEGRKFMLWGIIGLAVMSAVWALVFILTNTFFGGTILPILPA